MPTLLPNGKQQFFDGNGQPLAAGLVYFYIPNTNTLKNTWQDPSGVTLNSNPVQLDSNGEAIIYGSGSYRQILKDSLGNTIWDQLTADTSSLGDSWAGNSSGSANLQTISAPSFSSQAGQKIWFITEFTNTGPTSLVVSNLPPIPIIKSTPLGPVPLTGGELVTGDLVGVAYDINTSAFQLINPAPQNNATFTIVSAATTDIGSGSSNVVSITGTTTITSLGTSANAWNPIFYVTFTGALVLTYNAISLILPSGASITTAAGDSATFQYLGAGNWKCLAYTSANGLPIVSANVGDFRNRFINPAFLVDQRNKGASQTIPAGTAPYTVDRWLAYCSGANVTGQRTAYGFYQLTGAASVTSMAFTQRIEAINSYDMAGKTCTLSAYIANSVLTAVGWSAYYATTTDNFSAYTLIATGGFTVSATSTRYSASFAVPLAATTGIQINFSVGAQTSGTWVISNPQFEIGAAASAFEQRPIQYELPQCQRYYEVLQNTIFYTANQVSGNYFNGSVTWTYKATKRTSPTVVAASGSTATLPSYVGTDSFSATAAAPSAGTTLNAGSTANAEL